MRRAHAGLVHRTVRYHSAVVPKSSATGAGLIARPHVWLPDQPSLDLEIFRRRLAAVADNLVLDLLAFIERAEAGPLHRRDMDEHILPAALRLDEPVALGRIEPLHCSGRHNDLQDI